MVLIKRDKILINLLLLHQGLVAKHYLSSTEDVQGLVSMRDWSNIYGDVCGSMLDKSLIDTRPAPVHPNVQYSLVERLKNKHIRYQNLTKIPVYHTTFKNILSKDVKLCAPLIVDVVSM